MRFDQENINNMTDDMINQLRSATSSDNPELTSLIYELQQNFLPRIFFNSIPEFIIEFRAKQELFLHGIIRKSSELMYNKIIQYPMDMIDWSIEIIDNNFEIIEIIWNTNQTMLAKRMYFVTDLTYSKGACFLSENTFGGGLMFCRIAQNLDGTLGRVNYGPTEDNENLDKKKILDILLGY